MKITVVIEDKWLESEWHKTVWEVGLLATLDIVLPSKQFARFASTHLFVLSYQQWNFLNLRFKTLL